MKVTADNAPQGNAPSTLTSDPTLPLKPLSSHRLLRDTPSQLQQVPIHLTPQKQKSKQNERQGSLFQTAEQKNSAENTPKDQINNLPGKKVKSIIIKVLITIFEKRIDGHSENFNKELGKKKRTSQS